MIFLHSSVSVHGTAFKAVSKRLKLQVQERNAARPIVVVEVVVVEVARIIQYPCVIVVITRGNPTSHSQRASESTRRTAKTGLYESVASS